MALEKITKIAKKLGINEDDLELYGNYKAKIKPDVFERVKNNPDGKLILVTAITPTKAGEGKTTASIALADGLAKLKQKALICLREPSMGPVFGLKGGATGGGKVTVEPSEDINLHFTGDMHCLTSSINLIAAIIDNHIYQGNELRIDKDRILWKRAIDTNDRELRNIEIGFGEKNGVQRKDHFEITVASELMAILCISTDREDFVRRLNNILVAYDLDGNPVYLKQLNITNAIMKIMNYALWPNIVQTAENNPCLIHGGPFANIAHGCSSLIATKLALKLSPIVITEAGFAADLGAEKFLDIKCRIGGLTPSMCVLVATIRALKMHGGEAFENLNNENLDALKIGVENLEQHYENLKKFGIPIVIAINHFAQDTDNEIKFLSNWCEERGYKYAFLDGFLKGGDGSIDLANKVLECLRTKKSNYKPLYDLNDSIENKITKIAKEIYRADGVDFTPEALKNIEDIKKLGKEHLVVCMAKTQSSFSDNPKLLNCPKNFRVTVKEVKLSNGAEFIVALLGSILTMPGLPKVPQATLM
jgi:formate--tetrahydrofolate ligase